LVSRVQEDGAFASDKHDLNFAPHQKGQSSRWSCPIGNNNVQVEARTNVPSGDDSEFALIYDRDFSLPVLKYGGIELGFISNIATDTACSLHESLWCRLSDTAN
jgi:hypothetical protein